MKNSFSFKNAAIAAAFTLTTFAAVAQTSTVKPAVKTQSATKTTPAATAPPVMDMNKPNPLGLKPPAGVKVVVPPTETKPIVNDEVNKFKDTPNPLNLPAVEQKKEVVADPNAIPAPDPLGLRAKNGDGPEPSKTPEKK